MHDREDEFDAARQVAMADVDPEWFTSGCIITGGKSYLVTLHMSYLIMQTRLYAEAQASAHERDAKTATTESSRLLMMRIAQDLRRWASGDRTFLESATMLWQCSVPLAVRAKLGFLSVTEDNFYDYVAEVMGNAVPARRSIPPTFLFLTGPGQPELFVTQESEHLFQFASDWIYSRLVTKSDLKRLYDQVAKEYPAEKRRAPDESASKDKNGEGGKTKGDKTNG